MLVVVLVVTFPGAPLKRTSLLAAVPLKCIPVMTTELCEGPEPGVKLVTTGAGVMSDLVHDTATQITSGSTRRKGDMIQWDLSVKVGQIYRQMIDELKSTPGRGKKKPPQQCRGGLRQALQLLK